MTTYGVIIDDEGDVIEAASVLDAARLALARAGVPDIELRAYDATTQRGDPTDRYVTITPRTGGRTDIEWRYGNSENKRASMSVYQDIETRNRLRDPETGTVWTWDGEGYYDAQGRHLGEGGAHFDLLPVWPATLDD